MTDAEKIDQARQYAIAIGRDPDSIQTTADADRLFGNIADECKKYGCD